VMNIKDDDRVSAVALVVESEDPVPPEVDPSNEIELEGDAPSLDGASEDGAGADGSAE
jgi:hypothetical protein